MQIRYSLEEYFVLEFVLSLVLILFGLGKCLFFQGLGKFFRNLEDCLGY